MSGKRGAIFYPDHVRVARGLLEDADLGRLFLAVCAYAETGEMPCGEQTKEWQVCFDLMRSFIDDNNERYVKRCERNRQNANARWTSTSSEESNGMQSDAVGCDGMQSDAMDAKQSKAKQDKADQINAELCAPAPSAKRFTPPTIEEVRAYCLARGNNVDAQRFADFYEASGWRRGKTPIKDWRACVRTWERNSDASSRQSKRKEIDPYVGYEPF